MPDDAPTPADLSEVSIEELLEEVVRRGSAAVVMVRIDDPPATHLLIGADTVASYGLARIACKALEQDLAAEVFGGGDRAG